MSEKTKTPRELAEEQYYRTKVREVRIDSELYIDEKEVTHYQLVTQIFLAGLEAGAKMGWEAAEGHYGAEVKSTDLRGNTAMQRWWASLEGEKSPKASGDICIHCKAEVNNRCDDNYNASHSEWCCPHCNKWQNVNL